MITPEQIARTSEHSHQTALFAFAAQSGIPELRLMFAIPNGEQRSAMTGAKLKAAGVKAGIPDIFLPVARGIYHGLFMELKVDDGKLSIKQSEWLYNLQNQGYATRVCYGWETAKQALLEYLNVRQ